MASGNTMNNCTDTYTSSDKWKHLIVCFCLSVLSPIIGIVAGVTKELYDHHQQGNHWCWKDIVADAVGVVLGSAVHFLLRYFAHVTDLSYICH